MRTQFVIKRLEDGWQLTNQFGNDTVVMKRGDYPIGIRYAIVHIANPKYALCFAESEGIAQEIANAFNPVESQEEHCEMHREYGEFLYESQSYDVGIKEKL